MTDTEPTLRDRLTTALRDAAYDCDGNCSKSERECDAEHPIQTAVWHFGQIADITGSVDAIADALVAVVQPMLDAKDTEIAQLTRERDAADEALHGQPVLRHCVLPGCLREYDTLGGLSGRPVRESWSSKGWLRIPSLHSSICPDHTWLVADDAHRPNWDRTVTPTVLVCACTWRSPGVRWTGFATAAWRDHLLTVTEET